MAHTAVGTAPVVAIPFSADGKLLVQNLGPGALYVDTDPAVSTATGIKIAVNGILQLPDSGRSTGAWYAVADQAATDMRTVEV